MADAENLADVLAKNAEWLRDESPQTTKVREATERYWRPAVAKLMDEAAAALRASGVAPCDGGKT